MYHCLAHRGSFPCFEAAFVSSLVLLKFRSVYKSVLLRGRSGGRCDTKMLVSCGDIIRPSVFSALVFFTILLSNFILGTALDLAKSTTEAANGTAASPPTTTVDAAENFEPPISGATFANACYDYIHNFTYSAIVYHDMDQKQARKWHQGRDREQFMKMAGNLAQTIMKLVEQMDQIGAMFSVHKEVPTEMYSAPAQECPQADDSNRIVPFLILVILVLVSYIGFLSHQIKTKYRNSSSTILIEDR